MILDSLFVFFFFFFQAEDGIRDLYVTGVQTCALPIWGRAMRWPHANWPSCYGMETRIRPHGLRSGGRRTLYPQRRPVIPWQPCRSEERRVGKEWRSQRGREQ